MKKFVSGCLVLGLVFTAAFYVGKASRAPISSAVLQTRFEPSRYPLVNRSFVIAIVGRNNGAWLEKTLRSAVSQNYPQFRVIYIDDASDDGSFDLVKDLVQESREKERITLLRNETEQGELVTLAHAIHGCDPQEIVVRLGGEDWLAHEWVLTKLNQYYANSDLWMTYGQSREYPGFSIGAAKALDPALAVRSQPFSAAPLQSFYADLFQQVALEDLQIPSAIAQSYMFPMLEMAAHHAAFIPDVLYIVNQLHPKEPSDLTSFYDKSIRSQSAYTALATRPSQAPEVP